MSDATYIPVHSGLVVWIRTQQSLPDVSSVLLIEVHRFQEPYIEDPFWDARFAHYPWKVDIMMWLENGILNGPRKLYHHLGERAASHHLQDQKDRSMLRTAFITPVCPLRLRFCAVPNLQLPIGESGHWLLSDNLMPIGGGYLQHYDAHSNEDHE